MNKEQLEKMFDEEYSDYCEVDMIGYELFDEQKKFIFNKIIPKVLNSIIPEYEDTQTKDYEINMMRYGSNDCISDFKQKAKELYNIDL